MRLCLIIFCMALAFSCKTEPSVNQPNTSVNTNSSPKTPTTVPFYGFEVVNTYKHDPKAFTEGLFFHEGFLYESTGETGKSSLRKVAIESGKPVQKVDLPSESFGEGITLFNGKIYQLTWQEGLCRVFDAESFKLLREIRYSGEGWGLTHNDKNLIMSDGTHVIRYLDPETLQTSRTIAVFRENGLPLMKINELELIKGEIWANVWHSESIDLPNHIARIDPTTGKLLGWINLDGLSPEDVQRGDENTLNGIAYDEKTDRIFVTGKNWKRLFEIKLKPKS